MNSPLTIEGMRAEIKTRRLLRHPTDLYHKLLGRDNLREVVRHGLRWKLRYWSVEGSIIKKASWEQNTIEYFFTQAKARKCDIFLDVGAHVGYYTMLAAKMQLFEKIHAMEALPEVFESLRWHINENDFAVMVYAHQVAVSDSSGKLRMSEGEVFFPARTNAVDGASGTGIEVESATLDSLFDFRGRKLAIKMDIDGYEILALRGGERLFAENDIFLQVEILEENVEAINYLFSQGFRMVHCIGEDFYFERKKPNGFRQRMERVECRAKLK